MRNVHTTKHRHNSGDSGTTAGANNKSFAGMRLKPSPYIGNLWAFPGFRVAASGGPSPRPGDTLYRSWDVDSFNAPGVPPFTDKGIKDTWKARQSTTEHGFSKVVKLINWEERIVFERLEFRRHLGCL
jgi:hypothetical protein